MGKVRASLTRARDTYSSLIPGATNSHKGARKPTTEKKTKPKQSALRRENLFTGTDGVRVLNKSIVERSKDLRTAEEKAAILPWVRTLEIHSIVGATCPRTSSRAVDDARVAELALRELTLEQLSYRKGAITYVMTKPAMIAAQYRKLRGIQDDLHDEEEED